MHLGLTSDMEPENFKARRITELAQELEADIHRRKLLPGSPYLSLADAAKMLGVSSATANRALQLLAQRNILQRVQRKGTFIGTLERKSKSDELKRVCMLVTRSYLQQEGVMADGVLVGIQGELPGADVQFNFLPAIDPGQYLDNLIGEILRSKERVGIVMTKVPFAVQRAIKDSGLPAVIHGSPHPSIDTIPCVDQDNAAVARILADYIVEKKASHVCLLNREIMFPGDNIMLQELGHLLGQHGYGAADVSMRFLPEDMESISADIKQRISEHPQGLCLLCRSQMKADAAAEVIRELGLKGKNKPHVIVSGLYRRPTGESPYPYIFAPIRPEEIGAAIGKLLAQKAAAPDAVHRRVLPVQLARS